MKTLVMLKRGRVEKNMKSSFLYGETTVALILYSSRENYILLENLGKSMDEILASTPWRNLDEYPNDGMWRFRENFKILRAIHIYKLYVKFWVIPGWEALIQLMLWQNYRITGQDEYDYY
ncbi:hypothetical protein GIB67_019643 [Kingdonia uniflora]|uniref:Uncharacterized protein n=1 Tax=Kingdonia uniflora TaxID=39325 RepID=A0A7J7N0P1_9MAGN|nr:hypothetical protein GIB67_019643 [Kingdonia uniflora]